MVSIPQGTKMFQFPWFPSRRLCIHRRIRRHAPAWVSPFGHLRLKRLHTPPRSFSQCTASFFGTERLRHSPYALVASPIHVRRNCSSRVTLYSLGKGLPTYSSARTVAARPFRSALPSSCEVIPRRNWTIHFSSFGD